MRMSNAAASSRKPQPLDESALRARLAGLSLGHPLIYLPVVESTNTYAMNLARAGAAEGALVITDEQTAGRGRVGRAWRSLPRRQLELSLVLRPTFPPHFLVMAAALAVAQTVEAVTGVAPEIKWPNDVLAGERKLCGILIETGSDAQGAPFAVLGVGLNVNGSLAGDPALAARAATLADLTGHDLAREEVAGVLLTRLADLYAFLQEEGTLGRERVRAAWRARLITLGKHVRVAQGERTDEGVAEDVDADGALLLRRADGSLLPITWGDVG